MEMIRKMSNYMLMKINSRKQQKINCSLLVRLLVHGCNETAGFCYRTAEVTVP